LAPSPLSLLVGLKKLTLESGRSSGPNTPAGSPITMPQPPLPKHPAPPSAPKACKASKPSAGKCPSNPLAATPTQHLTAFVVEVPVASWLLNAVPCLVKHTYSDTLSASDNGSNAARIYQEKCQYFFVSFLSFFQSLKVQSVYFQKTRDADCTIYGYSCTPYGEHTALVHTIRQLYLYVWDHSLVQYGNYYSQYMG
jgi:hypothetical protein